MVGARFTSLFGVIAVNEITRACEPRPYDGDEWRACEPRPYSGEVPLQRRGALATEWLQVRDLALELLAALIDDRILCSVTISAMLLS
jgi:hypothetical protein